MVITATELHPEDAGVVGSGVVVLGSGVVVMGSGVVVVLQLRGR